MGTWNTHLEKHQKQMSCAVYERRRELVEEGYSNAGLFYSSLKAAGVEMQQFETAYSRVYSHEKGASKDTLDKRYWAPAWAIAACHVLSQQVVDSRARSKELREQLVKLREHPEMREAYLTEARLFWGFVP
jgi:hypothetical protein